MKAQTDAEKKALTDREAKIKAAEATVNKKMTDAAATVKNAQNLQNQAKKVKADADKKNKDAAAAMAKAVASGKAVDKKLADEKKKLAADAKKKVDAANKAAATAKAQATAEAKTALDLKQRLGQAEAAVNKMRSSQAQVSGVAVAVAVPQVSQALRDEAQALIRKFPTVSMRTDHPGHDIVHHGFDGKLQREAVIKHCLSDCVNRGCGCAAVTFSSDFRNCWLKNENAIKNQKPIPANDRATLIKPSRRVRLSAGRYVTRWC
jgi:hypothetical protein